MFEFNSLLLHNFSEVFSNLPDNVEKEAEFIYRRILNEKLLDCTASAVSPSKDEEPENSDFRKVDINSISNEDSRTFGDEWLCKQMFDNLSNFYIEGRKENSTLAQFGRSKEKRS